MKNHSILIIDDEEDVCRVLADFFRAKGYSADHAFSGREALEKIKLASPEIVLLDILMPDMDGLQVLQKIRLIDKEIGVIMVTGVQDHKIGLDALKQGALDFVIKPIDLDYLETSVLAKIISNSGE